jgi:hypothetical protein
LKYLSHLFSLDCGVLARLEGLTGSKLEQKAEVSDAF